MTEIWNGSELKKNIGKMKVMFGYFRAHVREEFIYVVCEK